MVLPGLVLATLTTLLAACSGGGGGGGLQDALDLAPAGAARIDFRDRAGLSERLDIPEDADADAYVDAIIDGRRVGGTTELTAYVETMAEGGALIDDRDVVWELSGSVEEGGFTVYRVEDDVDLDALLDDLVSAGLAESEIVGRRRASGELTEVVDPYNFINDRSYPFFFRDTTIDTDEHLVILGDATEAILETLDGERDSVADAGTFDDLLAGADDAELVSVFTGPFACNDRQTDDADVPPELAAQLDDLGRPVQVASLVTGEAPDVSARLEFDDEDVAERDLDARRTFLAEGTSLLTREPFTERFTAELEVDGTVVSVAVRGDDAATAVQLPYADGPLACGPES